LQIVFFLQDRRKKSVAKLLQTHQYMLAPLAPLAPATDYQAVILHHCLHRFLHLCAKANCIDIQFGRWQLMKKYARFFGKSERVLKK